MGVVINPGSIGNYPIPEDNDDENIEKRATVSSAPKGTVVSDVSEQEREETKARLVESLAKVFSDSSSPKDDMKVMARVIQMLIELTSTMQGISVSYAASMTTLTNQQNQYVQLLKNIIVATKSDVSDDQIRQGINQTMSLYAETVRANKGKVEDRSKKLQTLLNASKESATQFSDFLTTMLDSIRTLQRSLFRT